MLSRPVRIEDGKPNGSKLFPLQGRSFVEVIFIAIREIIQIRGRARLIQAFNCTGDKSKIINATQQLPGEHEKILFIMHQLHK